MSKTREMAKKSEEKDSSDSDSLIEIYKIPGSDYIRKSQISDLDIRSLVVRCTTCLHQINHHDPNQLKRHRRLKILVCNDCYNFYGDSEFSQDESGNYNYCTWCGNGGTLYLCDFCPNPFCSTCVRRNFGRKEVSLMSREGWKCFLCNPKKLKPKIAYCDLIINYCRNNKQKQEKRDKKLGASVPDVKLTLVENQDWVLPIFDQLNDSCKGFHKHLEKLKQIAVADNRNLKKVIVKLEEIVNAHKTELSKTVKSLSNQYTLYANDKIKAEERRKKMELRKENGDPVEVDAADGEIVVLTEGESSPEKPQVEEKVKILKSDEANRDPMEVDDGPIVNLTEGESSPENGQDKSKLKKLKSVEATEDPIEIDGSDGVNVNSSDEENSPMKTKDKCRKDKREVKSMEENGDLSDSNEPDASNMDLTNTENSPEKDQDESEVKDRQSKLNEDPNYVAKMMLISDSSSGEESESVLAQNNSMEEKVSKSDKNCDNKLSEGFASKDDSKMSVSVPNSPEAKKKPSQDRKPSEFSPKKTPKLTPIKKRVNRILFSDTESSDNDPLIDDCIDKAVTSSDGERFSDTDSKNKSSSVKDKDCNVKRDEAKDIDIENDPKLELPCFVLVDNCRNLMPENETTIPVPANFIIEELNKEVNNLCKLPSKLGQKRSNQERKKGPVKKKPASLEESDEGSGSIQLTSDDDSREEKKKNIENDPNFIAKKEFSATSSEEDVLQSLSSDQEEEKKPEGSKKSQKARQKDGDSSDDFQPISKKRKLDKLLSKRLSSSDEDPSKKKKDPSNEKGKSKKKRLILTSDDDKGAKNSDSSVTTTDTDSDDKKKKKKKRIKKRAASSSEHSVEEINEPSSTPGKGRKNIQKIIHQKDLKEETKNAQLAEKERKKRVQDRQKMYNVFQEKNLEGIENKLTKFVLEIDPESKEELVQIDPVLVTKLKPHQIRGVKFMWECTIESLKELKESKGSGCVLAHCMGLGKTLQVVTFLHTCMTNPEVKKKIRTAMVICPYNTVLNWRREFDKWLGETDEDIPVHELTIAKDNPTRFDILKYWKKTGGVLIASYDIFRRMAAKKIPKMSAKNRDKIHELLINPGADIVICDEGHILKNIKSAISIACLQIGTARRIVLTGTPLQNNLEEYHCMLSFVKPHLLGTLKEFRNRFVHPITNGQYDDSLERDVIRMKKRIHILHKLLDGCVQRCDYSALTKFLPPKYEFVISVKLTEVQAKMYKWYLENLSKARNETKIQGGTLFQDYNVLRNLCAHPYIVHTSFQQVQKRKLLKEDDEEGDLSDFINDESEESKKSNNENSSGDEEVIRKYKTRSHVPDSNDEVSEEEEQERKEWYFQFISETDSRSVELSGKMVLLIEILKECEAVGDKLVLFSQSLLTLNSIEDILEYMDEQPVSEEDKVRDIMCRWVKNIDYFRMDGGTSADFRRSFIDRFNDPKNDRARLFLVSTKAGGLGTNLVGANRVIMFDVSWNPSHDVQAIFRVYRFGQLKPVYIYRFLGQGTMEEKIYDRQVNKLSLSIRVVDEQQIDRHFNAAELAELYQFEPEIQRERPTPLLPKDTLLAEMLIKLKDWIVTYHEHDSLLENKTEEDLTEEERQAAWNEYENEREGRSADYIDINDEIAEYLKEPDFNLAHYEGTVIPSCKQMIENYIKTLKNRFPSDDVPTTRKKLLLMVHQLITAFRDKHVKILRIKQEYCAKGSVPSTVNQYLEELNLVLGELHTHFAEIKNLVNMDVNKAQQVPNMAERARQIFLGTQANRFQTARPRMQMPNVNQHYSRMSFGNQGASFQQQFIANAQKNLQDQFRMQQLAAAAQQQYAAQQKKSNPKPESTNFKGTVITEVGNDDSVLIEEESSTTGVVQEAD